MAGDFMHTARGAVAILDFLGPTGKPVGSALAQKRALVCQKCPLNVPPKGWVDKVASSVAKAAKEHFRLKDSLKLHVEGEEGLGICQACFCPIKLKIWMPIEFIAKHTTDEVMADFTQECWIPNELPL